MRSRDPAAIKKVRDARVASDLERLIKTSAAWMPTVRAMRPTSAWGEVVRAIGGGMTVERLRRGVKRLVSAGLADAGLLDRAAPTVSRHRVADLIKVLSETCTLQEIASKLEDMGERAPRGGVRWHPSSVRNLLLQVSGADAPPRPPRGPHKTARERFHAKFVRATQSV
jgi:hypothetical protein